MRRLASLLTTVLVFAACGSGDLSPGGPGSTTTENPTTTSTPTTTTLSTQVGADTGAIYAAALESLITEDNTFGAGPPPFSVYLVQADLDPSAGTGMLEGETRPLTEEERDAIEDAVANFGEVTWIDDPAEWRTEDLQPTVEGGVILGVGVIEFDDDAALVPVSLWCGGLCGTWFTYRLAQVDGSWTVTGIEGPVMIS